MAPTNIKTFYKQEKTYIIFALIIITLGVLPYFVLEQHIKTPRRKLVLRGFLVFTLYALMSGCVLQHVRMDQI